MRFDILNSRVYPGYFCIRLNGEYFHNEIKIYLKIPPHDYYSILFNSGGVFIEDYNNENRYCFKSREEAQKTIDMLESYLIMNKLTEG